MRIICMNISIILSTPRKQLFTKTASDVKEKKSDHWVSLLSTSSVLFFHRQQFVLSDERIFARKYFFTLAEIMNCKLLKMTHFHSSRAEERLMHQKWIESQIRLFMDLGTNCEGGGGSLLPEPQIINWNIEPRDGNCKIYLFDRLNSARNHPSRINSVGGRRKEIPEFFNWQGRRRRHRRGFQPIET